MCAPAHSSKQALAATEPFKLLTLMVSTASFAKRRQGSASASRAFVQNCSEPLGAS